MPTISSVRPHQRVWPKRLPHALSVPATSLWFNLEVSARRYPDKTAYLFFGQPLSFSALQAQAQAVAGWLQRVGVKAGDRVALYLQNCPQFVVAYYAILRANAVVVPVNPMNKMEELTYQLQDAQAQVVICAADLAATVQAAQSTLEPHERLRQVLVTHYSDAMPPVSAMDPAELAAEATDAWLRAEPALPAACLRWSEILDQAWPLGPHTAEADDLAMLQYTSGTTGHPKGCMHSHRSLMSNAVTGCWTQSTVASVGLGVVPFFHITGLVCFVLRAVFDATSTVILPRWDRELAGPLSGSILKYLNGVAGFNGWQWLFVLQGLPASVLGVVAFLYLQDGPDQAKWLSTAEKRLLSDDLAQELKNRKDRSLHTVGQMFRDPKVYLLSTAYFMFLGATYMLVFWMPSLIQGWGVADLLLVGLITTIPNIVGIVGTIVIGLHSDKRRERRWHFVCCMGLAVFGLGITTLLNGHLVMSVAALSLAYLGIKAATPLFFALVSEYLSVASAAAGIALISSLGNLGPAVTPWLNGVINSHTGGHVSSMYLGIGMYLLAGLLVLLSAGTAGAARVSPGIALATK